MQVWAIILGLVAVAASFATAKSPCCMADKWEGRYLRKEYIIDEGALTTIQSEVNMSYDRVNQRIVSVVNKTYSTGKFEQYIKLGFYADSVEYIYNPKDNTCEKQAATYFPLRCLPDYAKEVRSNIGLEPGQMGKLWNFAVEVPGMTLIVDTVLTDSCSPIFAFEIKTLAARPERYEVIGSFYDSVQEGIVSEDVFNLPAAC